MRTLSVNLRISHFMRAVLVRNGRTLKLSNHRSAVHFRYSIELLGGLLLVVEKMQTAVATAHGADGRMGDMPVSVSSCSSREPRWCHGHRSLLFISLFGRVRRLVCRCLLLYKVLPDVPVLQWRAWKSC